MNKGKKLILTTQLNSLLNELTSENHIHSDGYMEFKEIPFYPHVFFTEYGSEDREAAISEFEQPDLMDIGLVSINDIIIDKIKKFNPQYVIWAGEDSPAQSIGWLTGRILAKVNPKYSITLKQVHPNILLLEQLTRSANLSCYLTNSSKYNSLLLIHAVEVLSKFNMSMDNEESDHLLDLFKEKVEDKYNVKYES